MLSGIGLLQLGQHQTAAQQRIYDETGSGYFGSGFYNFYPSLCNPSPTEQKPKGEASLKSMLQDDINNWLSDVKL